MTLFYINGYENGRERAMDKCIQKKMKIDSYNSFRGICALGILFSHMSYLSAADNIFWKLLYDHFMQFGSRCSSFFFIMSGFLLAYTWKDVCFKVYISGKLKRIYPLTISVFFLALGCSFILNDTVNGDMLVGSPLWMLSIVLNLVMLKAFVPIESVFYSFHGPSWYISVLFVFYVIGYFIIKKIKCSKDKNRMQIKMCVGIMFVYVIQFLLCFWIDKNEFVNLRLYLAYINPYFRIFGEGMLGVLLCEYMSQIQKKIKSWNKSVLEIAAMIVFVNFFVLNNFFHISVWSAWVWFIPFSFVLIVFYKDAGIVSRLLKGSFWQFLGDISFEVYMTHAFVYEGIPIAVGVVSKDLSNWIVYHAGIRFVITLIASVAFAWIVHIVFHFKKLKK